MRTLALRRTALAASAAALALLATACGGSGDGEDKGGDAQASPRAAKTESAAPAAAKALTAAELEKAALTQADVKTGKVVEKVPAAELVAQDKVAAQKQDCVPLAQLQVGSYVGKPAATVQREWKGDPKKPAADATAEEQFLAGLDATQVLVTLASYEDGGAEQAMKELNAAVTSCAGGFTFTSPGDSTDVTKVAKTDAPQGGDEALAVTSAVDVDGDTMPVKAVVVRVGATLAYFPALNIGAASAGQDYDFPTEILDAQLAKLK
ncbi:hypothetical protein ABZ920_30340 [Streptomyces sp. NPDC046831]|uniref:hypothetical protein n=1 Tax=Streptomyces sp. NPDC046831 TaxID=3154805 RepID=UPI0033D96A39